MFSLFIFIKIQSSQIYFVFDLSCLLATDNCMSLMIYMDAINCNNIRVYRQIKIYIITILLHILKKHLIQSILILELTN